MIELGDEVKDKVTGFRGIATGRSVFLQGCARVCVQPSVDKAGKNQDALWVDEPQLTIIKKQKVKQGSRDTGGPMPSIPTRHTNPSR